MPGSDAAAPRMTEGLRRRGLLVSATCLVLWAATALTFAFYAFVVGITAEQQRAVRAFARAPLETTPEPLTVLVGATIGLGVLAMGSLLYYVYTQWCSAHLERLALESELADGRSRDSDLDPGLD